MKKIILWVVGIVLVVSCAFFVYQNEQSKISIERQRLEVERVNAETQANILKEQQNENWRRHLIKMR
jgi:uncharacterized protein YxeA